MRGINRVIMQSKTKNYDVMLFQDRTPLTVYACSKICKPLDVFTEAQRNFFLSAKKKISLRLEIFFRPHIIWKACGWTKTR
jgi:hypothetical protein